PSAILAEHQHAHIVLLDPHNEYGTAFIIDLSGIPTEIADVVVAMLCRLTFDFALWSERERMPPVLLVCEEAHRYVSASPGVGFAAAGRAITRLAREGRKYGIALALVTQLPSELSSQALSQCGTVFALR